MMRQQEIQIAATVPQTNVQIHAALATFDATNSHPMRRVSSGNCSSSLPMWRRRGTALYRQNRASRK